MSSQTM